MIHRLYHAWLETTRHYFPRWLTRPHQSPGESAEADVCPGKENCPDCIKEHGYLLDVSDNFKRLLFAASTAGIDQKREIKELKGLLRRALEVIPYSELRREIEEALK